MIEVLTVGRCPGAEVVADQLKRLRCPRYCPLSVILVGSDSEDLPVLVRSRQVAEGQIIVVALAAIPAGLIDDILLVADDFLEWEETTVDAIQARCDRWEEMHDLLNSEHVRGVAIGRAPKFLTALTQLIELATMSRAPVLLSGETGTGKEVAARLVYTLGSKPRGHFVVVDCTTVVPTLSGSEFFGHERGAFTGAVSTRTGAFAAADGGTLFLDEVGELPLPLQAELLRVIQEGTYKRVGGDQWNSTNFRLVCATNRDLLAEIAAGRFRSDLFHRIAGGLVHLPALRDRAEDIEEIFAHFLSEAMGGLPCPPIAASTVRVLRSRDYPGNLRELRQLALRVASRHTGPGPISPGDVPGVDQSWNAGPLPGMPPPLPNQGGAASGSTEDGLSSASSKDGPGCAAHESADISSRLEDVLRALLREGVTLVDLRRLVPEIAVKIAIEEAGGSTRGAARRLGVSDRAVQARRSELKSVATD